MNALDVRFDDTLERPVFYQAPPEVEDGGRARGRFPNSVGFPEIRGDEFRVCEQWIGEGRDIRQAERPAVLSQQRDNAPRNLAGCPSRQNGARIVSDVS